MSVLVYDCGSVENTVTAILDTESGAMIIRGNGDVDNYMNEYSPWYSEHSNITQLTVDKGITRIGSGTFYGCENLSFVEIANTVTSIGTDVFKNCTALSRIKIPKTITNISNGAFADSGLSEVRFYGNPPTVGTDIFDGVTADIYTPEGNEEWTETAKGTVAGNGSNLTWKDFDSKPNLIEYDELDYLWSKIKKYVDSNVSVTQVVSSGTKIATITINGVATDIYSSGGLSGTVGSSTTPIYIDNGVPTACGGSLAVDITGNAATATTASKLGNTTAIGNVSTPVYISSNGAPTVCNNFASASIAANGSTTTPAGWFRIFSLNHGYENGLIIVGGGGHGASSPCFAVLSFSISNNKPNISLISSGNITTGAGGSTTKIRITCGNNGRYVEAYNNSTAQNRNQFFRIFTNVSGAVGYNIAAGSTPNGEELSYTATVDINKNTEPCLHTTDSAVGSTSLPVYIDANGVVQACTSVDLNATSATTATNANNVKITGSAGAWHDITGVTTGFTPGSNYALSGHSSGSVAYCVDANATSGNQRAILRLGNSTANTTAAGHNGVIWMYGTSTGYTEIKPGYNSTGNIILTLPSATGTIALTSSNITGSSGSCTGNAATATTATNANNAKLTHTVGNTEYPLVFGSSFVITDAQQALRIGTPSATANQCPLRVKAYCAAANTQGEAYLVLGNALALASANNSRGGLVMYGTGTAYNFFKMNTVKTNGKTIFLNTANTADITLTLPSATGTIALTTDITGKVASGGNNTSGYCKVNGNCLIQFGQLETTAAANYTITLPTSFANTNYCVFISTMTSVYPSSTNSFFGIPLSDSVTGFTNAEKRQKTSFTFRLAKTVGGQVSYWLAIGF